MDAVAAREMMDVSLSALRLGAQEVHLVCLETRGEMPAALEEIEEAEEEGIIIHPGLRSEADYWREWASHGS
jgi:NADPH-dependent glutamate synthase beta subunit-like oxidoreductase